MWRYQELDVALPVCKRPWRRRQVTSSLVLLLLLLTSAASELTVSQQFTSRYSQVYVIPNFLPNETALAWRTSLQQLWNQTMDRLDQPPPQQQQEDDTCSSGSASPDDDTTTCADPPYLEHGFTYATNNNGELPTKQKKFHNAKYRSLENIPQRRWVARQMKTQQRQFAYAKWELDPAHPLVAQIQNTLTEPHLLHSVSALLQHDDAHARLSSSREMSDIFVTHYDEGDFLSAHNDGISGTWAVVIGLVSDDYDAQVDGGALQFQCPGPEQSRRSIRYCQTLHPQFNTAVIFATRVVRPDGSTEMGPSHRVLDVTHGGRFSITGWWMDVHDVMSGEVQAERDLARGRK